MTGSVCALCCVIIANEWALIRVSQPVSQLLAGLRFCTLLNGKTKKKRRVNSKQRQIKLVFGV